MADTVKVVLDRARAYRARQEDREAIWVGPGEAEVPAWVADAWGLTPQPEAKPPSLVEVESPEGLLVLVEEEPADEVADEPPAPAATRRRRRKGQ